MKPRLIGGAVVLVLVLGGVCYGVWRRLRVRSSSG